MRWHGRYDAEYRRRQTNDPEGDTEKIKKPLPKGAFRQVISNICWTFCTPFRMIQAVT
jgi:hypothetical protein